MLGQPPFSRTPEYHPQAPLNPPEDENPLEWLAVRRLADEFLQRCPAAAATNPRATAIVTKLKSQSTDALGTRAVLNLTRTEVGPHLIFCHSQTNGTDHSPRRNVLVVGNSHG